jgi:exodeoxyribonuclease V alpha subunit
MTRELLYTGVTRAAKRVTLAGSAEVLVTACARPTARESGLIDRFREACE